MNAEKLIESFIKTFYPEIDFKIHPQYDSHWMCDLPERWKYNVEIVNFVGFIYNPVDFSQLTKLTNSKSVDLTTIYTKMDSFIPNISEKVTFFYMTDKGKIFNVERFSNSIMASGATHYEGFIIG